MPNKWYAAILGLVASPLAWIYLSRFQLAATYFALFVPAYFLNEEFKYVHSDSVAILGSLPLIALALVSCVHAYKTAKRTNHSSSRRWFNHWWGPLALYLVVLTPLLVVKSFFFEPFSVSSTAMQPGFAKGDLIIISKWGFGSYGIRGDIYFEGNHAEQLNLSRGDVVAFRREISGTDRNGISAMRVVGVPGDRIEFRDKRLILNSTLVDLDESEEPDVFSERLGDTTYQIRIDYNQPDLARVYGFEVPKGHFYVLGDNRQHATDSRLIGPVAAEDIIGKVKRLW